jgi:hypothetical protein
VLRRTYKTLRKAVPAIDRLRAAAAWRPSVAAPEDGRLVSFGGTALRVFGDADDPYYASAPAQMATQGRLCSVLRACLPRDGAPVALDVGANIGLATMAMAVTAPRPTRLLAVEPSPRNLAHLRRNLAANGLERVEVVAAAAGAEPGVLAFHEAGYGAGSHVVSGHHLADGAMPAVGCRGDAGPHVPRTAGTPGLRQDRRRGLRARRAGGRRGRDRALPARRLYGDSIPGR